MRNRMIDEKKLIEDIISNDGIQFDMDFESTKAWYNGYLIDGMHMYNPNSVSMAMNQKDFDSYWKNTSSFASINTFITMNYAGLKDDVMKKFEEMKSNSKKEKNKEN